MGTAGGQDARLGILGAGRLGRAIAQRWRAIDGQKAELWSRRFDAGDGPRAMIVDDLPFAVVSLSSVMSKETVIAAIPSSGLAELAERDRSISSFSGTLLVTGIDLALEAVQRLAPAALVRRVVPGLLAAPRSISSLVLDGGHGGERWSRAKAALEMLGPVHCVDDEQAFESIMYLTSPFPVVLRAAISDAVASMLTRGRIDHRWKPAAESVLWDAISSLASNCEQLNSIAGEVATPGGVTAAGLQEVPAVSRALQDALQIMMGHGQQLRR